MYDGKETDDYWFFVNRWFDTSEDDGAIERELIQTEENGHPLGDSDCTYMKHHTNLQKFAPGFVNYKKGALDSQPQVIKLTSWLPRVGGSLLRIKIAYSPENVVVTCLTRFLVFDPVPNIRIPGVIEYTSPVRDSNANKTIDPKQRNSAFIAVLHIKVTMRPSTCSKCSQLTASSRPPLALV